MWAVTIRQLQIFVDAAETRSFVRTAERLNVSPAAVSFQIKQIENMSGFALFERSGKTALLSDAGQALLDYARTVLQALEDADASLTALRGGTGGRVSIGLVSTGKYIVPHMLARFQAIYPSVSIHLREGNRRETVGALVRGEIELAIMGRPPPEVDITAEPFAIHPSVIVASPSHPQTSAHRLQPSALAADRFIMREEGSGTRQLMEEFCHQKGIVIMTGMTSSSNETIKQAVMACMGIALISQHTVGLELALGLLRVLPVDGLPLMRSWFIAHRRTMPLLPLHTRLRAFLLEHGQSVIDDLERGFRETYPASVRPVKRMTRRGLHHAVPRT
jgi:LysR family transcriptional regulator, low CO2-responsive transcriptional regulator